MIDSFSKYILKIVFIPKQMVIFAIIAISFFLMTLFFLFFETFQKYYIEELKSIYPPVYIVVEKKAKPISLDNKTDVVKEIFDISFDNNFELSFDGNSFFSIGSMGLRSFSQLHPPKIIQDLPYSNTPSLYVSPKVYTLLKAQEDFQGYVYLVSDKDQKSYKFDVVPIPLHNNLKWILVENSFAKKLFLEQTFNKFVYYSSKEDTVLKKELAQKLHKPIFSWDDNISLVNKALKESMIYIFSMISLAIVLILFFSFFFFGQAIIDDLYLLTINGFYHGISFWKIFITYIIYINILLFSIFYIVYRIALVINDYLVSMIWNVTTYDTLSLVTLFYSINIILIPFLWFKLYRLEKVAAYRMGRSA